MAEVLQYEVFLRGTDGPGILFWNTNLQYPLAALSAEQTKEAYLQIPDGKMVMVEDGAEPELFSVWASNIYKTFNESEEAPKKDLEEAYFYWITQGKDAAIRRLRGDTDL